MKNIAHFKWYKIIWNLTANYWRIISYTIIPKFTPSLYLYNMYMQEYLVINGIIASPFGANHMMANLYYNIHRLLFMLKPTLSSSSFLQNINEELGLLIPLFGSTYTPLHIWSIHFPTLPYPSLSILENLLYLSFATIISFNLV